MSDLPPGEPRAAVPGDVMIPTLDGFYKGMPLAEALAIVRGQDPATRQASTTEQPPWAGNISKQRRPRK